MSNSLETSGKKQEKPKTKFERLRPFLSTMMILATINTFDFKTQFKTIVEPEAFNPQIELNANAAEEAELKNFCKVFEAQTGVKLTFPSPNEEEAKAGYKSASKVNAKQLKAALARPSVLLKLYNSRSKEPVKVISFFDQLDENDDTQGEYFLEESEIHVSLKNIQNIESILTHEVSHGLTPLTTPELSREALKYYLGENYELLNKSTPPKGDATYRNLEGGLRTYILQHASLPDMRHVEPNDVLKLTKEEQKENLTRPRYYPAEAGAVPAEAISSISKNLPKTPELKRTQLKYITLMANGDVKMLSKEFLDIIKPVLDPSWDGNNIDSINQKLDNYFSKNEPVQVAPELAQYYQEVVDRGLTIPEFEDKFEDQFNKDKAELQKQKTSKLLMGLAMIFSTTAGIALMYGKLDE